MDVCCAAFSRPGSRDSNQDSTGEAATPAGRIFVVADGAGGHLGGAIASRVVVDAVTASLRARPGFDHDAVAAAIDAATLEVRRQQKDDRTLVNMSSTVTVLCIDAAGERACWGHLGDSRIYHFRRGIIEAITRDHSVVQSLMDAGIYSPGDVRDHADRSVLFAAIGSEGESRPAVAGPVALQDGDAFLLCSDGVWDVLRDHRLEALLRRSGSAGEWIAAIEQEVIAGNHLAQDNFSAIAVWIGSPEAITVFGA
jgi:serine/threonine protein phosphatase PrpC